MEFWNSILTEKSWKALQDLKKENFKFILIGGWAAYLWTKQHKSKDIDIIIPEFEDLTKLKLKYDLKKNNDLKKYEIKKEEIDVDIYIPFYSRLTLPIEDIKNETTKIESFDVVKTEILLILKQGVEYDRGESVKGEKDRIDIMTLLIYTKIDFEKYRTLLNKYKLENLRERLKNIIKTFRNIKHLNINEKEYLKIKNKLIKEI